jgi:hypothetical protein
MTCEKNGCSHESQGVLGRWSGALVLNSDWDRRPWEAGFFGKEQARQPKDAEYQEDESMHYRETRNYQSLPNVSSF